MNKPVIAFIVPTGINASIGGFAGDASTYAQNFSRHFRVIVNPNVVNAGGFSGINKNMLYVEGSAIDDFFEGKIALKPVFSGETEASPAPHFNKIGVVFDKAISKHVLNVHVNTINAVKTVYGIDVSQYVITDDPAGIEYRIDESNISNGEIKNPLTLLKAANKLISKGCDAIAVVCAFRNDQGNDYKNGIGVDPVGGIEAIISHFLTKELHIPVAHSPAFEDLIIETDIVDPRAASEYITPTYLPCVLIGLSQAPQFLDAQTKDTQIITADDVKALVMPFNSLGAPCVLSAAKKGIKIIAVRENVTSLKLTGQKLGINDIIELATYEDCLEYLKGKL